MNLTTDLIGLPYEALPAELEAELQKVLATCKAQALAMVARANSGHPAGSLSSLPLYLMAYLASDLRADNADACDRDYVSISHGHTSPAAYATLAALGLVTADEAIAGFRKAGTLFSGHVERTTPGIDWSSGNLGQGLSAGIGFALALKARGLDKQVYVLMGDGEQPKGQVAEARRLAVAQNLRDITVLVDANDIQISGRTEEVLPVHTKALWEADGWKVIEADGGSFASLYAAMKQARASESPCCILAKTVMGNGVSFMENVPDYHGKAATGELYAKALAELGQADPLACCKDQPHTKAKSLKGAVTLPLTEAHTYGVDEKTDCRGAFGKALTQTALAAKKEGKPFLVFDCDLAGSVKTDGVAKETPEMFVQSGIQEHNTATVAGAASVAGVKTLFAGFGMFGLVECYNQQRLNDINETNLTLALTHVGLDVGEDGPTHQCIDYVGLLSGCMNWKLVCPADGNQADRATRWALAEEGNTCLAMGRSKLAILADEEGKPLFARPFIYGQVVKARSGKHLALLALGPMTHQALAAAELLKARGIEAAVYSVSCPLAVCDETLKEAFSTGHVLTVEDHRLTNGMGSLWLARAAELGLMANCQRRGVTHWGCSAPSSDVYKAMGLDASTLADVALDLLS